MRPQFLRAGFERIGLGRPELRAWAFYDWANSAMATTIVAAVFPIYYYSVAGAGLSAGVATQRYALSTTIALVTIAVLAPFLGALADAAAAKKKLLALFAFLGAGAVAAMACIDSGEWVLASVLLVVANIGAAGSLVFYDALLPHVARAGEIDRVSTAGYALGYLGGGLLLALQLAWIQNPERFGLPAATAADPRAETLPVRLAFVSVAVWWVAFTIPLLRRVPEPPAAGVAAVSFGHAAAAAWTRLAHTATALGRHRHALMLLIAFLVYNDGLQTIVKMASIYGTEIGIGRSALISAILLVQFVGIPCTIAFGVLASRVGPKPTLYITLAFYTGIAIFAYFMRTATHFFILAVAVGLVQGGCQALSRSLFASLIPRRRSSEFFGLFAVAEKFAGILGPALFATTIHLTGSSRKAIISVVVFFVAGAWLLRHVDVDAGRRAALEADATGVRHGA
jgi:UMF1 family MFS transporter